MNSKDIITDSVSQIHEHVSCELLLTTLCNMNCSYCIAKDLKKQKMPLDIGKTAIDMFLYLSQGARYLDFVFTGGEPLLEYNLLRKLVSYIYQCTRETDIETFFSIKTNGTILNESILDFICNNHINIIVSIDGTNTTHDLYRKDSSGKNTHCLVVKNLSALLNKSANCSISLTVHPNLVDSIEDNVKYLHEMGIKNISLGPAYGTVQWKKDEYIKFIRAMDNIAKYLKFTNTDIINLEVGPLYKNSEHIGDLLSKCWGCGALSNNIAFLPNGQITGCSALAMLTSKYPEMIVGNTFEGLNNIAVNHLLHLAQTGQEERRLCQNCKTSNNCKGGCIAINLATTGYPLKCPDFYCKIIEAIQPAWKIAWE